MLVLPIYWRGCAACCVRPCKGVLTILLLRLCSLCPTFASVAVFINNARWAGVPFLLKAGKALASRRAEIRVQFHQVPGGLYQDKLGHDGDRSSNELVRTPDQQRPSCESATTIARAPP